MQFGECQSAVIKPNSRDTLSFTPTTTTVEPTKTSYLANARASREGLDVADFADDLEVHEGMVANPVSRVKLCCGFPCGITLWLRCRRSAQGTHQHRWWTVTSSHWLDRTF